MNFTTRRFGGLRCQVFDALPEGSSPRLLAVFCHGFGAPGTDLVALGPELTARRPVLSNGVRFVFPEAPLSLDDMGVYGGRAWWHLDLEERMAAIARGEIRNLRNERPEGMDDASTMLRRLVGEAAEDAGLTTSRVVLGGFSQGGMIATDAALALEESPAGLIVFSGTLICEDRWRPAAKNRAGLPAFVSHGRQDPILPFVASEWLRDLLVEGGLDVEFLPFDGPHTIPREALSRAGALLERLAQT